MWTFNCYILFLFAAILPMISCNRTELIVLKPGREWRCTFRQTDNCGIVNQSLMPSNFSYLPESELFGDVGLYYLETSGCSRQGARLMTPYFRWPPHVRSICLTIRYIIFGKGVQQLSLLKQDRKNAVLWTDIRPGTGRWQLKHITVSVYSAFPARFFIESRLRNETGFLAISEIAIHDSYCMSK